LANKNITVVGVDGEPLAWFQDRGKYILANSMNDVSDLAPKFGLPMTVRGYLNVMSVGGLVFDPSNLLPASEYDNSAVQEAQDLMNSPGTPKSNYQLDGLGLMSDGAYKPVAGLTNMTTLHSMASVMFGLDQYIHVATTGNTYPWEY
jgi:hypothetical protein